LDGTLYFGDVEARRLNKAKDIRVEEIVDLRWSPGEDLLIVLFKSGLMCMFALDANEPSIMFEKSSTGISSL
jgi:hypothetical protein